MRISAYGATDIGRRRKNNEDGFVIQDLQEKKAIEPPILEAFPIGEHGVLLAVCDGMGGHNAGEVASSLALTTLASEMHALHDSCPGPELFRKAITAVNERVWREASLHPKLSGMGTTLTAVHVCRERALIAHVGDSRAYFARQGRVEQVTKDQSIAGTMVASGQLTEEQARKTPFRHVLLQAIGTKEQVEVALDGIELLPGDTLLLCSDGLSGKVDVDDLARHLASEELRAAADGLIALANERGGEDNITVVLARLS